MSIPTKLMAFITALLFFSISLTGTSHGNFTMKNATSTASFEEQNGSADLNPPPFTAFPRTALIPQLEPPEPDSSPPASPTEAPPSEGGKAGADGEIALSNSEFIAALFPKVPEGASAAVCSKYGSPHEGGWVAIRADAAKDLPAKANNYVNGSSFHYGADGEFHARKNQFAACHFLLLDDIGTKVSMERLGQFELTWLIETSPGNFQGGIVLDKTVTDAAAALRLHKAIIAEGLCDPGAGGPLSRWARLPVGVNGKPQYADRDGMPFRCRLVEWNPSARYTPDQIVAGLSLTLPPQTGQHSATRSSAKAQISRDALIQRPDENPVINALKEKGLYKREIEPGKHDITCPWLHEHTLSEDTGTAFFEPDQTYPLGGFCCQHSHRDDYHIRELLQELAVTETDARHKTIIRVSPGDIDGVVDAAERQLATDNRYFQSGGLVVSVKADPVTGDASIVPANSHVLTRELASIADWERWDNRKLDWIPTDPPQRHISILLDGQAFRHLSPIAGIARQPYFRDDGKLIIEPGYDPTSKRFAVFPKQQYRQPDTTREAAEAALAKLNDLLDEFPFASPDDRSAALSAILTAATRPSLPHAPAIHVRAPVFGSGKTYLCDLFSGFAGPAGAAKVSYPSSSEEATKAMLSLLITGPAVIEFDDMDSDWSPHGVIKRMLTAESITDRVLGMSKVATVSTRSLILGSGNNVGPVRDLLRRVLPINLDPRTGTPATKAFNGSPVSQVRQNRAEYVMAALTVVCAWQSAGSPRADVSPIATYGGAWADYCRHPLIWLGLPDPASGLLEQIRHDPDAEALGNLMLAWRMAFGSNPTTVRKAVDAASNSYTELQEALSEFPVIERGEINRSKLGWLLKKNANRIVNGYEFKKAVADGRTAWQVAAVSQSTPPSPPLPPFSDRPERDWQSPLPPADEPSPSADAGPQKVVKAVKVVLAHGPVDHGDFISTANVKDHVYEDDPNDY